MTDEEKTQVRLLRINGYSYGKIAKILDLKRSTVSDYCLRYQIKPMKSVEAVSESPKQYRRCSFCQQLFLANTSKSQQFCSSKCRTNYWNREKQESKRIGQDAEYGMTLQVGLDFLGEESDELGAEDTIVLGRKPITKS